MKYIIVGIFDRKAQAFISMEPTPNQAVAARTFGEIIQKGGDNPIAKWPRDFELYELGTWDNETGLPTHRPDDNAVNDQDRASFQKKLIVAGEVFAPTTN